jgi:hypothetical protein
MTASAAAFFAAILARAISDRLPLILAEGQLPMLKKHLEIAQSLKRAAAQ